MNLVKASATKFCGNLLECLWGNPNHHHQLHIQSWKYQSPLVAAWEPSSSQLPGQNLVDRQRSSPTFSSHQPRIWIGSREAMRKRLGPIGWLESFQMIQGLGNEIWKLRSVQMAGTTLKSLKCFKSCEKDFPCWPMTKLPPSHDPNAARRIHRLFYQGFPSPARASNIPKWYDIAGKHTCHGLFRILCLFALFSLLHCNPPVTPIHSSPGLREAAEHSKVVEGERCLAKFPKPSGANERDCNWDGPMNAFSWDVLYMFCRPLPEQVFC